MLGSRGICLCECNSIIRDSLRQLRSACHLNSCTGKAVSTKVTQRTARNISRARGASDISNGDCSSISRGEEPSWTRELVSAIRVRCSNIVHAWQAPLMPLVDSLDVDSNCYRGGGHRMSVMRILLPFCKKIPCAGRHSAAFG